jgi:hypothetical protein
MIFVVFTIFHYIYPYINGFNVGDRWEFSCDGAGLENKWKRKDIKFIENIKLPVYLWSTVL